MHPEVLILPDSLRERLEAAFDELKLPEYKQSDEARPPKTPPGIYLGAKEHALRRVLFAADAPPADRAFVTRLLRIKQEMETGRGIPAVDMENLPPTRGQDFAEALCCYFGSGGLYVDESQGMDSQPQVLHVDGLRSAPRNDILKNRKSIPVLYCASPGTLRHPTVFATADEIMAQMGKILHESHPDIADPQQEILRRLSRVTFTGDATPQPMRLLQKNTNYRSGDKAPRYYLAARLDDCLSGDHNVRLSRADAELIGLFVKADAQLRAELSATSRSGIQKNTLTFFNNLLTHHARGIAQGEGAQVGREIMLFDAKPLAQTPGNRAANLADRAFAPSCSRIHWNKLPETGPDKINWAALTDDDWTMRAALKASIVKYER